MAKLTDPDIIDLTKKYGWKRIGDMNDLNRQIDNHKKIDY